MTTDEAIAHLRKLADANDGTVTFAQVEGDPFFANDRETVKAAAHILAAQSKMIPMTESGDGGVWFPYSMLRVG